MMVAVSEVDHSSSDLTFDYSPCIALVAWLYGQLISVGMIVVIYALRTICAPLS